jgi:hypothetical protein
MKAQTKKKKKRANKEKKRKNTIKHFTFLIAALVLKSLAKVSLVND